jgi:hypothetical protein
MRDTGAASALVSRVARGGAFFVYSGGIGLTYFSQLVIARIVGVDILWRVCVCLRLDCRLGILLNT